MVWHQGFKKWKHHKLCFVEKKTVFLILISCSPEQAAHRNMTLT